MPKFDPHEVWRLVETEKVNSVMITGDAMGKPLIEALDDPGASYDLSSLLAVTSSAALFSAPVKDEFFRHFPNIVIVDAIGSSESGNNGMATMTKGDTAMKSGPTVTRPGRHGGVRRGPQAGGARVRGRSARSPATGDIPVGYYNDPVKTAEVFITVDGIRYVMPGDFATIEADGTITLLGRGSVSINSGGEKIFPEEVESAVRSHPDVFDAIVVGAPDERWGQRVAAIIQPRADRHPTLEDIQDHCRDAHRRLQGAPPAPRGRDHRALPERQARLPVGGRHRGRGSRGDRQRGLRTSTALTGSTVSGPTAVPVDLSRAGRARPVRGAHHGDPAGRGRRPDLVPPAGRGGRPGRGGPQHRPAAAGRPGARACRSSTAPPSSGPTGPARRSTASSSPPWCASPTTCWRAPRPPSWSPGSDPSRRDLVSPRLHGVSPFTGTSLDTWLRSLGVETVVATGVSVNLGVLGLAIEACNLGYQVVVPRDTVAGIPAEYADAVLDNTFPLIATLTTIDDLLEAWRAA